MTNFEKLKNMTPEQIAAEFMIFRPSDACFDDENRNYYALASAEVIDGFLIYPASGMEICDDDFCSYGERKEN